MTDPSSPASMDPEASVEDLLSTRLSVVSLQITGASRTNPALLQKLIHPVLSTGGTFSGVLEDITTTLDRLRGTNCFRGVDAYVDKTPTGDASVSFTLNEKSLYQIQTGTSIKADGERDASVTGSFLFRNLTRSADTLKASVEWGGAGAAIHHKPSVSMDVRYERPFVAGLDTTAFTNLRIAENNHGDTSSYSLYTRSAEAGLYTPAGKFWLSSAWRQVADVADEASGLIREEAGHSTVTSLNHSLSFDGTDHAPMPTEGSAFTVHSQAALPVGSSNTFVKLATTAQTHVSIAGGTLSFSARSGLIFSKHHVKLPDRFFLGGSNTFRGFKPRGVGPRDKSDALGGDVFYTLTSMLSLPMPQNSLLRQMFNARMHAFACVGDMSEMKEVRQRVQGLSVRDGLKKLTDSARVSVGLGIALETSVGRIEINVCRPIRQGERDVSQVGVQFGLSEAFL